MVVIQTASFQGINPFYPLLAGRRQTIRVVSWERYGRFLRSSTVAGITLCILGILLLSPSFYTDDRFNAFAAANLLFSIIRTWKMLGGKNIDVSALTSSRRTTILPDIEFATTFIGFGLACVVVATKCAAEYQAPAGLLAAVCLLFAFVPAINSFAFMLGIGHVSKDDEQGSATNKLG